VSRDRFKRRGQERVKRRVKRRGQVTSSRDRFKRRVDRNPLLNCCHPTCQHDLDTSCLDLLHNANPPAALFKDVHGMTNLTRRKVLRESQARGLPQVDNSKNSSTDWRVKGV
jgi:hypothetical protein